MAKPFLYRTVSAPKFLLPDFTQFLINERININ